MKLNQPAIDRLLNINWFSNIGEDFLMPGTLLTKSLHEALKYLSSPEWENVTLEESNEISGYLAVKHTVIYQEWNDVAQEAKSLFVSKLTSIIPPIKGFDDDLLRQCIEWDLMHYLIEDFYRQKLKKPLFFENLVSIYESGHMPCGWSGNWPNGQLVIY